MAVFLNSKNRKMIDLKTLNYASVLCLSIALASPSGFASEPKLDTRYVDLPVTSEHSTNSSDSFLQIAQGASNKSEAAQIAKSKHGGKVLKVDKAGNGWRVKLLVDDGKRVKMVYVEGKGNS